MGLGRGDHCACIMPNRYEMATAYFACQILGAIFTPFNWRATVEEIAYVLEDAEAVLILIDEDAAPAARKAAQNSGIERIVSIAGGAEETPFAELLEAEPVKPRPSIKDDDICLMLYTSGTTGRPKGVPRSISAERTAAMACIAQLRYRAGERSLGVMPLFHTMGIRVLLMTALIGGAWVNMRRFDPAGAVGLIAAENINALFLVPTMFHDMLGCPEFTDAGTGSVRNVAYAGMAMTSTLERRLAAAFMPDVFANYYGSSEIFTFSYCDDLAAKPGSAGRAGMGQVLRIVRVDAEGTVSGDDIVPQGEIGEVVATMNSAEAFSGYWKCPDADRKAIRDGWYFTGDLGYFDEDGSLFLCGRVDDMIISGGENIHPEEVENTLAASGLVGMAAVVGETDERWGQKVVAYIEPVSAEASAVLLDVHCRESALAGFKRPRKYVFVEKIPVSASGKLLRRLLREGDYVALEGYETALE